MMDLNTLFHALGISVVVCPTVLLVVIGITSLINRPLSENSIAGWTQASVVSGLLAAILILGLMLGTGIRHVPIEIGDWVVIEQQYFHFHVNFVFDRLSVPFVILSFTLIGTVGAFTSKYLHREPGYRRFFVAYAMFLLGMIVSSLAGTIETLFLGWELVGLSSSLLIAYFHERQNPVRNGIRVWSIYRVADAAFLIAALLLHHLTGTGDFDVLIGEGYWPEGNSTLSSSHAFLVGLLLLVAAAGKSALIPFSGWLPRAMEGPTSSSAVFYGALSVHLGAFLLLRVGALIEQSTALSAIIVVLGLASATFGALASRVQSDIKSSLAFSSLTQVGIIVAEIGLGFRYLALIHLIGHACLRTLQLLRAPSLLHDYHTLENAIGGHLPQETKPLWGKFVPARFSQWLYRFALERGYFDASLNNLIVNPFLKFFKWCDRMESLWTDFLSGEKSRESDRVKPHPESLEEFL